MSKIKDLERPNNLPVINQRPKGGLILKVAELQKILAEPDATGIGFSLQKPGLAANVQLEVFKVTGGYDGLNREDREVTYRMGAAALDQVAVGVDEYCFEKEQQLRRSGFHFAVIWKDDFNRLIKDGEDEVFVGGASKDYGEIGNGPKGIWFTLKMEPRWNPELETMVPLGIPPKSQFMEACPPFWTPDGADGGE